MKKRLITFFILITAICSISISTAMAQSQYQKDIYDARDRVLPALIHIQPVVIDYLTGREKKHSVVGSGIIISSDGYAVTNYHVAGRAERIICTLHDREQVPATLIGGDPATDVAVIKLDLSNYHGKIVPATLGNSKALQVGQTVLAMGSPLALSRSVSKGVISTVDRFFPGDIRLPSGEKTGRYNTWLQTDAAINPGNSGGPLVNLDGEVVGINTRGIFFAENIGFSIPINTVKDVAQKLIESGKVERSWIGVDAQPLQDLEQFFGADANRGVLIASIDPGSPAEIAGLKPGEIILEYNGQPVSARFEEELPDFYQLVSSSGAGQKLEIVTLTDGQENRRSITPGLLGDQQGQDFDFGEWGFTGKAITQQMAIDNRFDDTIGVYVTESASPGPASEGGLRRGDVIKQINRRNVSGFGGLKSSYDALKKEDRILLTVSRNNDDIRYVLIKRDKTEDDSNE